MEPLLNLTTGQQGAITALATAFIAIMAVVTGVLTYALIRENRLLRKAGTEPEVVAHLVTDPRHKTMINFALTNIGRGAARFVSFKFDADEGDFSTHKVQIGNKADRKAISLLPPGEKIEAFFGAGHELYKEPRLQPFKVTIEYQDLAGRYHKGVFSLDVSQFDGLIFLGAPAEHEIAEALKKLERHIGQLATGYRRLQVETITSADAQAQAAERLANARARQEPE